MHNKTNLVRTNVITSNFCSDNIGLSANASRLGFLIQNLCGVPVYIRYAPLSASSIPGNYNICLNEIKPFKEFIYTGEVHVTASTGANLPGIIFTEYLSPFVTADSTLVTTDNTVITSDNSGD